jgi:hypothetical protein
MGWQKCQFPDRCIACRAGVRRASRCRGALRQHRGCRCRNAGRTTAVRRTGFDQSRRAGTVRGSLPCSSRMPTSAPCWQGRASRGRSGRSAGMDRRRSRRAELGAADPVAVRSHPRVGAPVDRSFLARAPDPCRGQPRFSTPEWPSAPARMRRPAFVWNGWSAMCAPAARCSIMAAVRAFWRSLQPASGPETSPVSISIRRRWKRPGPMRNGTG